MTLSPCRILQNVIGTTSSKVCAINFWYWIDSCKGFISFLQLSFLSNLRWIHISDGYAWLGRHVLVFCPRSPVHQSSTFFWNSQMRKLFPFFCNSYYIRFTGIGSIDLMAASSWSTLHLSYMSWYHWSGKTQCHLNSHAPLGMKWKLSEVSANARNRQGKRLNAVSISFSFYQSKKIGFNYFFILLKIILIKLFYLSYFRIISLKLKLWLN